MACNNVSRIDTKIKCLDVINVVRYRKPYIGSNMAQRVVGAAMETAMPRELIASFTVKNKNILLKRAPWLLHDLCHQHRFAGQSFNFSRKRREGP